MKLKREKTVKKIMKKRDGLLKRSINQQIYRKN